MKEDKKFQTTVLGMDMAVVAFITKIIHDLAACQTSGFVMEYAPPDDEPPEETDDDVFDADMIVVADNDTKNIVAIKTALRNGLYPGIVVVVIVNPEIPIKKSGEPEGNWDRTNFHYGAKTTQDELSRWLFRRIDDADAFRGLNTCIAG